MRVWDFVTAIFCIEKDHSFIIISRILVEIRVCMDLILMGDDEDEAHYGIIYCENGGYI